jgi:HSP20 family protein
MVCVGYNTFSEHPFFGMNFHHPAARAGRRQAKFGSRGQCGGGPARFARRGSQEGEHGRSIRRSNLHVADLGDKFQLSVDFPGVKASALTVQVEDRVLTICGDRFVPSEEGVRAVEYVRRFRLDESIDAEHLSANLADGVLVLTAPKIQKAGPINVAITTNPSPDEPEEDTDEDDDMVLVDVQEGATNTEDEDGDKKPAAADPTDETKESPPESEKKKSEAN